jgi:hypothetical protein
MFIALAGAALGYAEKNGITIPHFGTAGEAGTLAIAGFAAKKLLKIHSPLLDQGTASMVAIAAYQLGKGELGTGGGASKDKSTTSGDEYDAGYRD